MQPQNQTVPPVVIVGIGLAGLTVALELADQRPVVMLAKRSLSESATAWAQGGIVGVLDQNDNIESHVKDTITADCNRKCIGHSLAR